MDLQEYNIQLGQKTEAVEQLIRKYLPAEQGYQKTVLEAMNYSLLAGGKRLRPLLMSEVYQLYGGTGDLVEPFMIALEMIHTYSLVHDDLPAMDNDEYRRGRETTWKVYGDGMAILAGDGLLNYAFETAFRAFEMVQDPEQLRAVGKALTVLGQKAGIYGMIGGQTADIEAEEQEESLTTEQLLFIHEHKTAALIQAAMMIGAILAGADGEQVRNMERCAYNVGIAFQIQDDILDVIGDSKELGKQTGSDALNHKQTYVTLKGLERAKADVERLSEEALTILQGAEGENAFLEQLIRTLIHRTK